MNSLGIIPAITGINEWCEWVKQKFRKIIRINKKINGVVGSCQNVLQCSNRGMRCYEPVMVECRGPGVSGHHAILKHQTHILSSILGSIDSYQDILQCSNRGMDCYESKGDQCRGSCTPRHCLTVRYQNHYKKDILVYISIRIRLYYRTCIHLMRPAMVVLAADNCIFFRWIYIIYSYSFNLDINEW